MRKEMSRPTTHAHDKVQVLNVGSVQDFCRGGKGEVDYLYWWELTFASHAPFWPF